MALFTDAIAGGCVGLHGMVGMGLGAPWNLSHRWCFGGCARVVAARAKSSKPTSPRIPRMFDQVVVLPLGRARGNKDSPGSPSENTLGERMRSLE
jgi:hypothetical protein